MSLNCYKVQRIIHWSPPSDIEAYIQETGRGGWNGLHTKAILYNITSIGLHVSEQMKDYCRNTTKCRREILFENFDDDTSLYSSHQALMCTYCEMHL